jgi:hypothetical protein
VLNIDINYDDFNAYSLFEALQIAFGDLDGCFVCFGGNTFLVGKSVDGFFTFDFLTLDLLMGIFVKMDKAQE